MAGRTVMGFAVGESVDVILPVFNRDAKVGVAIESVLSQDYVRLRLYIVDDGSTDGTLQVCRGYERDQRVTVIQCGQNRGVAAARNVGIVASHGTAIAFIDSDDRWLPGSLRRRMVALSCADPDIGLVYCGTRIEDQDTGKVRVRYAVDDGWVWSQVLKYNIAGTPSRVLIRRSCLDCVGLFDERLHSCEDWDLWLRIARHYRYKAVRAPLVVYLEHSSSVSGSPEKSVSGRLGFIRKHSIDKTKKLLWFHYFRFGHELQRRGIGSEASEFLWRAWRLRPVNPLPLLVLLAGSLGTDAYRRLNAAGARLWNWVSGGRLRGSVQRGPRRSRRDES